ncbi:non-ribosomal peptide synthetase [Marinobacter sp. DUT-3]|uniref:non-ribosomal peptide synthetase n=1 Tax=Marinobacter sp. DUT-3 TaxID=3412036 RepID=UPI003D170345
MNSVATGESLSPQQKMLAETAPPLRWVWLGLGEGLQARDVEQALGWFITRHEALRTRYRQARGWTGLRQEVVAPEDLRLDWRVGGAGEGTEPQLWRARAEDAAAQHQPDLLAWLYQDARGGSRLLLGVSPLAVDDASLLRLRDALRAGDAVPADEPPMQYREYVAWIRELQADDEDAGEGAQFWRNQGLERLPGGRLPEIYGEPAGIFGRARCSWPADLQQRLATLAQAWDCPQPTPLLAAWAALLGRLRGSHALQLGWQHDCRDDYDELAPSIGLFGQILPLACHGSAGQSLRGLARELKTGLEALPEWQEYASLGEVQPLSQPSRQAGMLWRTQADRQTLQTDTPTSPCELLLQAVHTEQGDGQLILDFDSGLYRQAQMERLLARLLRLVEQVLEYPETALAELDLLLDDEDMASGALPPSTARADAVADVVGGFREQAAAHPGRVALRAGQREYSYCELDNESERVAAALQAVGAGPERLVALCLPRGPEAVVAMLAVLKTGSAYLPLDPQQPARRLETILRDARPAVLLVADDDTDAAALTHGLEGPWQILSWSRARSCTGALAPVTREPSHQVYVLYTSGSTGQPKGVQVENAQLNHYCAHAIAALALPEGGHYGLVSSLVADLGNTVLFPAWLRGGCLHLLDRATVTDGQAFADYQANWPLDVLKIVPSHLEALLTGQSVSALLPRQRLVLGGEPVGTALLRELSAAAPGCTVYNHYGPTETTVGVLWSEVDLARQDTALTDPIGDNRIYLLDPAGRSVPRGQVGELCVSGPGVTRGYLGNPEATAQAYTANPAGDGRLYRTGDLALQQADGVIRILGRRDHQVKLRGFRFELEEVERALQATAGVEQAAAVLDGEGEQACLLGLVTGGQVSPGSAPEPVPDPAKVREDLAQRLPDYMVPARILVVTALPLNDNGKVDRKALPELAHRAAQRVRVAPQNELERLVLAVWQDVLGQDDIGVTDNFFDIGGHSLAAIKVVARLRDRLERLLPTTLLFEAQTVRALAGRVEQGNGNQRWLTYGEAQGDLAVVLLHAVSGHLLTLRPLIDALQGKVRLHGLAADGAALEDSCPERLGEVLDGYVAAIPESLRDTPLVLVGWSLASRLALLLAERLQARGFRVHSLTLLDYDPSHTLQGAEDESGQLLADLDYYCQSHQIALPDGSRQALAREVAGCDYATAVERALVSAELRQALGDGIPEDWIRQRVMVRWRFKELMYGVALPRVDLPLWVWTCRDGRCDPRAWQAYSTREVRSATVEADHVSILASSDMHGQLLDQLLSIPVNTEVVS